MDFVLAPPSGILLSSLDKVLQPSVPQCPHLFRGGESIHLTGL